MVVGNSPLRKMLGTSPMGSNQREGLWSFEAGNVFCKFGILKLHIQILVPIGHGKLSCFDYNIVLLPS